VGGWKGDMDAEGRTILEIFATSNLGENETSTFTTCTFTAATTATTTYVRHTCDGRAYYELRGGQGDGGN
jgi:hypothetical protein